MIKLKKYSFPILMLLSLTLATFVGIYASDNFIEFISPLGDIFVNLMFTLVVPLVFFTITSSIATLNHKYKLSKILSKTFLVFTITTIISATFMLVILLFVSPSSKINLEVSDNTSESINIISQIASALTVSNFLDLFSKEHILALIIFSILFGISIRLIDKENKLGDTFNVISNVILKIVKIVMYYAPIGVFAYFSNLINSYGKTILTSYLKSLIIYLIASIAYFIIFYTIYAYLSKGKKGVKTFYKHIIPSLVCSLSTQSSLASLPTNLETSSKMGIDESVSKVALPLGSNIHMEGSAIGSVLKIFFLLNVFNFTSISLSTCLIALIIASISSIVMSGIPGGALIGETLIVSLYGFPSSSFTIIATIGWLIDAPATMLNVCGDLPSLMLIEKSLYKKKE